MEIIIKNLIRQNLHYDIYIGLDPGFRLIFEGSWRGTVDAYDEKNTIKIKSSTFRAMSGAVTRKHTLHKIMKKIEKRSKSKISPEKNRF